MLVLVRIIRIFVRINESFLNADLKLLQLKSDFQLLLCDRRGTSGDIRTKSNLSAIILSGLMSVVVRIPPVMIIGLWGFPIVI